MYEYKQKDKDIVSLSISVRDLVPSSDNITQDELRLVTSDAHKNLSTEEFDNLKKRFKKIKYTILDMEQNRKGFGVTEDAMQFFVQHFEDTKEDAGLHSLFKDHDYQHIDSLMGRVVDRFYDKKNKKVLSTAIIDLRHPSTDRLDMFQNLSTTLLHGKPVCSECGDVYQTCNHFDAFPRSTLAIGIEDSLVSIPAYKNANRDSLGMFKSSLSGIELADEFFSYEENKLSDTTEETKRIVEEEKRNAKEEEKRRQDEITRSAEETRKKEAEKDAEKETEKLTEIKKGIDTLKNFVEKNNLH